MQTTPSASLVIFDPVFGDGERLALTGFLAGYRVATRDAYTLDLRQFVSWCDQHNVNLFGARRADIEYYARGLEERGLARATVSRRLCTVAGLYRYAEEEGLIPVSPAVHVRRPRLDYESHAVGLDRNEVGALLVVAGLGPAIEHALISLLALNGLRVSEATGANIEALGLERGHRTLTVLRKGGKVVTIPLAPRTARAVDLAIGERPLAQSSPEMTGSAWTPRRVANRAPSGQTGRDRQADRTPHPAPRIHHRRPTRVSPSATSKRPPPTPTPAPPCATTGPESHSTATPPTSSPPSSPAPAGKSRSDLGAVEHRHGAHARAQTADSVRLVVVATIDLRSGHGGGASPRGQLVGRGRWSYLRRTIGSMEV